MSSMESIEVVSEAYGRRCIPKLLRSLDDDHLNEETKVKSLELLRDKLHDPVIKEEVGLNGGIEVVISMMFADSSRVVALGCNVIQALCHSHACRKNMIKGGVIPGLLHGVHIAPTEATSSLKILLEQEEMDCTTLVQTLETMKELLSSDTTDLKTVNNCLNIASYLVNSKDVHVSGLHYSTENNLTGLICSIAEQALEATDTHEREAKLNSCSGYFRSMSESFQGKQSLQDNNGIQILGHILEKTKDPHILIRVTGALMQLSINVPAKKPIIEYCSESLLKLLKLLKHNIEFVSHNVTATLLACCEDREVSRQIQTTLGSSELKQYLGELPKFAPLA